MNYQFLNDLILRAPIFSFQQYQPESIGDILKNPYFRMGLYLASPQLYHVLEIKDFKIEAFSEKERLSVLKYYNRMSFRPTPFGSFASFTLTEWGTQGGIRLHPREHSKLHLLIDQQIALQLARELTKEVTPGFYHVNPTLYKAGGSFRFIKTDYSGEKGTIHFDLESYAYNASTADLIRFCKETTRERNDIISHMMALSGCDRETAADYLQFLTGAQILLSSLANNIIGEDFLKRLLDRAEIPGDKLKKDLAGFYSRMLNVTFPDIKQLDVLSRSLSALLPSGNTQDVSQLFYAGLERGIIEGNLNRKYQQQITNGLTALDVLAPPVQPAMLQQFISDFKDRYDRRKISLLEALDPETGIGYGPSLLPAGDKELLSEVNFKAPQSDGIQLTWSAVHQLLLQRWTDNPCKRDPIILNDHDIAGLAGNGSSLPPPTLSVLFRVVDEGVFLESAGGATATALIARFSAWSPGVNALSRRVAFLEAFANPQVIFADIGQLSDAHADNINRRQQSYDYEIPVNTVSLLPAERQILPADLWVSVVGNELILESAVLKKRIIPRLSSAYNYTRNQLTVFRLLCDLQYQGIKGSYALRMEQHFPGLSFYPRVVFKDSVLCPAIWRLSPDELSVQGEGFARLRKKLGLPARIALTRHDQQLIFNLDKEEEVTFFLECVKGMDHVTLQEFLVSSGDAGINQFAAFLYQTEQTYQGYQSESPGKHITVHPEFILGSKWIYLKVYCAPSAANELLVKKLLPVLERLSAQELLSWFFIRYRDPDNHIRLRLKIKEAAVGSVLTRLKKRFSGTVRLHVIREYRADTYRREVERYGADIIHLVEAFFHRSSALILQYLKMAGRRSFPYTYHSLAFVSVHYLLNAFIPDNDARVVFLKQMVHTFYTEFAGDKSLKIDLDQKFRAIKNEIGFLAEQGYYEALKLEGAAKDFHSSIKRIVHASRSFPLSRKDHLLADMIHMHLNRLFTDRQRSQELIVYYCLYKHLLSIKARSR
jgi:thiopeptide-type bacteriocin biosynthesis protein